MMEDTRTPQEKAYDSLKDGSAYVKEEGGYWERFALGFQHGQEIAAALNDPAPNLPQDLKDWIERKVKAESKDVARIDATLSTLPSIERQLAAILPSSTSAVMDILAVTLPDGVELTRCTFNGAPAEWVELRWDEDQDVAIDVRGDGAIAGVLIGEHYLDDVSEADWEALRLLLAVDRQAIGRATTMPAPVLDAVYAWNHQPYEQWKRLHESVGFGAWYAQTRRLTVQAA